ncbi:NAD-dependent epimerase/dehydratase family protein [Lactovum odontotermitis]
MGEDRSVLVTGSTGFLGKYIVKEFADNDYHVKAFGRNVKVGKTLEDATFISGDFTRIDEIEDASCQTDIVVHAGALSTVWGSWKSFYQANVLGTENVARACLKNKVKRLVFVSSPSIYTTKESRLNISEDFPLADNRLNNYIRSKIAAEKIIKDYQKQGLETVILRPRGLFGIGDTSIIPRLIAANQKRGIPLINGGQNVVDVTYVGNVAQACYLAATTEKAAGEVFNITNGEPQAFKEILEKLFEKINVKPRYFPLSLSKAYGLAQILEGLYRILPLNGEPVLTRYTAATLGTSQTLDITKAREILTYQPRVSIEEGLNIYASDWTKNHRY